MRLYWLRMIVPSGSGFWLSRTFCSLFFSTISLKPHFSFLFTGSCNTSWIIRRCHRKSFEPVKGFFCLCLSDVPWKGPSKVVQTDTWPLLIEEKCGFWTAKLTSVTLNRACSTSIGTREGVRVMNVLGWLSKADMSGTAGRSSVNHIMFT